MAPVLFTCKFCDVQINWKFLLLIYEQTTFGLGSGLYTVKAKARKC